MATDNVQTSTWLRPETADAVKALAARDRRSVSMWLRILIEEAVEREEAQAAA